MIKGIYTSASAMIPRVKKQEVTANNVANAGTTGFKKDKVFTRELSRAVSQQKPKRTDWHQPMIDKVFVDFTPGVFDKTDNPLDLALEGDGFFTLESPDGQTVLTRSGAFQIDSEGFLSFPGGFRLVGEGGAIQVGNGELNVGLDGEIEVNGLPVDRIVPRSVADTAALNRLGGSLFAVPEGEELIPAISATIRQGYLETSNVDVVREMVEMMISYRAYEANAKALQQQDSSLDDLFTKVGGKR
ncbi:MAG: flagellar hook-basal body protein [Candidatus Zixiibacteriota bacterium]|nr:MAG: flagellar hook-basal body protein [candidate division Zixibacteria bacterium]